MIRRLVRHRGWLYAAFLAVVTLTGCTPQAVIATIFPDNPGEAIAVAECESGLDPNAVSPGEGNHGLFQINNVHRGAWERAGWSWGQRYDPILNTAFAKALWDQQRWRPWTCQP